MGRQVVLLAIKEVMRITVGRRNTGMYEECLSCPENETGKS